MTQKFYRFTDTQIFLRNGVFFLFSVIPQGLSWELHNFFDVVQQMISDTLQAFISFAIIVSGDMSVPSVSVIDKTDLNNTNPVIKNGDKHNIINRDNWFNDPGVSDYDILSQEK